MFRGFCSSNRRSYRERKKKLEEKDLDFIVANMPENIASDNGKIVLIDNSGNTFEYEATKKM